MHTSCIARSWCLDAMFERTAAPVTMRPIPEENGLMIELNFPDTAAEPSWAVAGASDG